MVGGGGADSFMFRTGGGADTVVDFSSLQLDKIMLQTNLNGSGITTGAQALALTSDVNGHAVIDVGGGNTIDLLGVATASLGAGDFLFF